MADNVNDSIGVLEGQRPHEQRSDDAEDGRGGADPNRKRRDGDHRERTLREHAANDQA